MTLEVLDFPKPEDGDGAKSVVERLEQLVEYAKERRPVAMFCVLLGDTWEHAASFAYEDLNGPELLDVVELAKLRLAREVQEKWEDK